MSPKYPNLLSPFKIGNVVFKNRMTASPTHSHFTQGTEQYPTEAMITFYANRAKNGAALVTCTHFNQVPVATSKFFGGGKTGYARYRMVNETGRPAFESNLECYLSAMTEAIHFYGTKASMGIMPNVDPKWDVSAGFSPMMGGGPPVKREEIPVDLLDGIAEGCALNAALMKELGFDMVFLHMSYRGTIMGRFLSPMVNKRTDQFGGSLTNQARFPIMVADRIKQKCGKDFLIEGCISGSEPFPGGLTVEDTVEYAKMFAGHFDLLQLRSGDMDATHPTGYNPERTPFLPMAEAVKKSGAKIAVVTIGGFTDLGTCENVIASGKADFIGMARSWISNPDFGQKAYEGRGEDVVPCLRCNKCHISSYMNPWARVCSVNPTWGFEHKIERMIDPPKAKKNVAVIGGGPAGMEAALVAAERGHQVTLYEKSSALGGLMKTSNNVSFKWPLKSFKNYMVHKVERSNIKVHLNTEATPEMLKKEKYDAVFTAVGSEPVVPDIPGVKGDNVVFAKDVYGKEDALAENVVVIGGGETGTETGMHLAEKGHKVTVLEMGDMLAPRSTPIHFYNMFQAAWEKLENFKYILQVRCNGIANGKVTYVDANGTEHEIAAGSVVIAAGSQPGNALAMGFYSAGERFFMIGDCNIVGDIQKTMRSAYSIASML